MNHVYKIFLKSSTNALVYMNVVFKMVGM